MWCLVRVVTDECPLDLGRWGFLRTPTHQAKGHPVDASLPNLSAGFDDPNLVSCAGLVPVMTLAERAGLHDLARAHVRVPGSAGSNADVKVAALVAGMVAGADSIEAMDLLRHGGSLRLPVFLSCEASSRIVT